MTENMLSTVWVIANLRDISHKFTLLLLNVRKSGEILNPQDWWGDEKKDLKT